MPEGFEALTEKEKQTLRLMVRGHDAKSMARHLDLSVHAINDRLRSARRKLEATSSREAARLLMEEEGPPPQLLVGKELGNAHEGAAGNASSVPETRRSGGWGKGRKFALLLGGLVMSLLAAALLLSTPLVSDGATPPDAETAARDSAVEAAARHWLDLVGAGDWGASYAATAASFRKANTLKLWTDSATKVQGGLGTVISRQFLGVDDVPSPQGFAMVKFRTDYTNRAGVIETLSLVHEDGTWKVAGIYVS